MKISKLFHWLYAILMLLPCFFIGGRVLYTIFNKNAKDSYSNVSANIGDNYTEIDNYTDFVVGERYTFTTTMANLPSTATQLYCDIFVNNVDVVFTPYTWVDSNVKRITLYRIPSSPASTVVLYAYNENNINLGAATVNTTETNLIFNFTYSGIDRSNNYSYFTTLFYDVESVYQGNTLDNAFSYSMEQLNENPIFAWAQTSFLVAPFAYITGLFGLAASNPINTLLSYWLSISIIWLVFDLVMYVPLLVHRWLDKGVLE